MSLEFSCSLYGCSIEEQQVRRSTDCEAAARTRPSAHQTEGSEALDASLGVQLGANSGAHSVPTLAPQKVFPRVVLRGFQRQLLPLCL